VADKKGARLRKARVIKEGFVTKQYEGEVFTPSLEDVPCHAEEVEGKIIQVRLTAESREGMKKRAVATQDASGFGTFSIWCDESTALGGEDSAPAPLTYFGAAIAF
jgi:hypothetical protein